MRKGNKPPTLATSNHKLCAYPNLLNGQPNGSVKREDKLPTQRSSLPPAVANPFSSEPILSEKKNKISSLFEMNREINPISKIKLNVKIIRL